MSFTFTVNGAAGISSRQRRTADEPYRIAFCVDGSVFVIEPPLDIDAKRRTAEAAGASIGETIHYIYGRQEQSTVGKNLVGIGKEEVDVLVEEFRVNLFLFASFR